MINLNECFVGIEFGSTRIKAVMIDNNFNIVASGSFNWENKFVDGAWSYSMEEAKKGLKECYRELKNNFENKYKIKLTTFKALGISGMMHGYLVFDEKEKQLAHFRTWRNTICKDAERELTKLFDFHVPQRWSIAHIYQAILNDEDSAKNIKFATTISGYFHYLLTGKKVIGIGDAAGMFPIDEKTRNYDEEMVNKYDELVKDKVNYHILDILPKVLCAGDDAGYLTKEGALLIDESGDLEPGIPLCAPEGDMGTGMVATNSIKVGTGNASLGTSSNLTLVTGQKTEVDLAIDVINSPSGSPAALIHVNNCTSDINSWVSLFEEAIKIGNGNISTGDLIGKLFEKSLEADDSPDNLMTYNFYSGEPINQINEGHPVFFRKCDSKLNLANFMRANINSALATLRIGLDKLSVQGVKISKIYGHGGFFKTPKVGQLALSSALKTPIAILDSAGEGGPYGMALLASYLFHKEMTLDDYLENVVFKNSNETVLMANDKNIEDFDRFLNVYKEGLSAEKDVIKVFSSKTKVDNSLDKLKEEVYQANMKLVDSGLVILTWGNVSGIDREKGLIVIKPSGVPYEKMSKDDMVVVDLNGNVVEGKYRPSSDTPTHIELYKKFKNIGGVVHTHSTFAVSWAQAGLDIPALGTTHADTFYGNIPCTRELTKDEIENDYELNTGKVIVETFKDKDYEAVPAVINKNHGPFTWGTSPLKAVENAIILEEVAKMAFITKSINKDTPSINKNLADKHYKRKHGKNAYYGQK